MKKLVYPALFTCADDSSNYHQKWYFTLLRAEYVFLFIAAILSMEFSKTSGYFAFLAFIFVISGFTLILRTMTKPEQSWYLTRALAESTKTLTWRYIMRAKPFDDKDERQAKIDFTSHLQKLLTDNKKTIDAMGGTDANGDQFTEEMRFIREMSLEDRRKFYVENRIKDQKNWYNFKALANKKSARLWAILGVITYTIAFILVMLRIIFPDFEYFPTESVIVFSSIIVGWMQIKKFNELASAYTLTANEIGFLQTIIDSTNSEIEFSDAVNDSELAFSREHTQWVARQHS